MNACMLYYRHFPPLNPEIKLQCAKKRQLIKCCKVWVYVSYVFALILLFKPVFFFPCVILFIPSLQTKDVIV